MRDVIWTLIVVWVVYKIYETIKSSRTYVYQKHEHYYNSPEEGETKVQSPQSNPRKPNSDKGGEYIDFEEIKN